MSLALEVSQETRTRTQVQATDESLRLEAVTVSVGFDDLLDVTLGHNMPHLDTMIVVTAHDDHKTRSCANKHGAKPERRANITR